MVRPVVPPGWPPQVRPPDAPGWQESAARWLLDICPPEFRSYPVLRRHVVALSGFAVAHTDAGLQAARTALAETRTSLRDHLEPHTVEVVVATWEETVAGLVARRRAVGLVDEALRGRRFRPRL